MAAESIQAKDIEAGDEIVAGQWRGGVVSTLTLISSDSLFFRFEDGNLSRPYATTDWVSVIRRADRVGD